MNTVVEQTFGEFPTGGFKRINAVGRKLPEIGSPCGTDAGEFHQTVGMDELFVRVMSGNGEIVHGPLCVDPPENICGECAAAEKIVFQSLFHGTSPLPLSRGERGVGIMV
jgi:hypothetical protein